MSIISTVAWLQAIYGQSQDPLIIRNDNMKPDLHKLVLSIFRLALRNTIDFKVDWDLDPLTSTRLSLAGSLIAMTRGFPYIFFTRVDGIWGPHSVDRFANSHNFKLSTRFYSRYWNLVAKESMPFAFAGLGKLIGQY